MIPLSSAQPGLSVSADQRRKRTSSEKPSEWASEKKKATRQRLTYLSSKDWFVYKGKIFVTVPGCPRAARARILKPAVRGSAVYRHRALYVLYCALKIGMTIWRSRRLAWNSRGRSWQLNLKVGDDLFYLMSRTWKSSNLSDDRDWAIRRFASQYFVYLLAGSSDKEIVFTRSSVSN